MKKKILCLVLAVLLILPSLIVSAANVTMYAQDGRTVSVDTSKVAAYKKVGWYEGVTMYAADGRTTTVSPFKVADYKKVGWYDKKSDVYTLLYTADGRVKSVPKGKVSEYTKVGWSTKPLTLTITEKGDNYSYGSGVLYVFGPSLISSSDYSYNNNLKNNTNILYIAENVTYIGSRAFDDYKKLSRIELSNTVTSIQSYTFDGTNITRIGIPKSVITLDGYSFDTYGLSSYSNSANKKMVVYCEKGSKAEAFAKEKNLKYVYATMIYSPDGRTMMVDAEEKKDYLASGLWLDAPCTKMYSLDGKTKIVKKTDVAAYKKVGWYDNKADVVTTMYATDGRTKEVLKINVAKEKAVGWFKTKPVKMYSLDGRTKYVETTDVAANKKVGWYDNKADVVTTMYALDGRAKEVLKINVAKEKAVGWYTLVEYGKALVSKKGGEAAIIAIKALEGTVDATTYNAAYKETLNAYYKKVGCPLVVLNWSKSTNSIGTPQISISLRNISSKTVVAFDMKYTCYDAYGKVTTDYPSLYTGTINSNYTANNYADYILSGELFSGIDDPLYSNEKTHSISWPVVLKVAFSDGTTWYK